MDIPASAASLPPQPMREDLARVQWRIFLRALAEQVDSVAGPAGRDDLLRGTGARMAKLLPLPPVRSLERLEMEMNDALAGIGWGGARLWLDEAERVLMVAHTGLPRIGSAGTAPGMWLAALLEGLFTVWIADQPGSDPRLKARLSHQAGADGVVLRLVAE